ncbi:fimbrial protein [Salmonella enterica subsp. enterica serovar Oslo]|nr:fimbrial protein [Salmonella enterica subsp. enterica serovar Oslo]
MLKKIMFILLMCNHSILAKNSTLNITIGANLIIPTCALSIPAEINFGNITRNDFLNGNSNLRIKNFDITASCNNVSRVELMFIPRNGTISGRNNAALTSNSSVMYTVSLIDLGKNNIIFNKNIVWLSPGTTSVRMLLTANGILTKGGFKTSMTIQLTYI